MSEGNTCPHSSSIPKHRICTVISDRNAVFELFESLSLKLFSHYALLQKLLLELFIGLLGMGVREILAHTLPQPLRIKLALLFLSEIPFFSFLKASV